MFCPKCGIANRVDQKFCRGCGHALAGHRAALENNFEDTLEKIRTGSLALGASAAVIFIISIMALVVWILQKDAAVFFTLVPVLAFVIPATIFGLIRLNRACRALTVTDRKVVAESKTTAAHLTAAPDTDPLSQTSRQPVSVTEHTTLNLESPESVSGARQPPS